MCVFFFFFFNDTATTEIYTLSLHDALPIWIRLLPARLGRLRARGQRPHGRGLRDEDSAEDGREGPRELGGAGALGARLLHGRADVGVVHRDASRGPRPELRRYGGADPLRAGRPPRAPAPEKVL